MAECIDEFVLMQDVICADQKTQSLEECWREVRHSCSCAGSSDYGGSNGSGMVGVGRDLRGRRWSS